MMTVQTKSWEQVGKKFEAIGKDLRRQLDETTEDAAADREAFEKALHALHAAIQDSLAAAGKVARNPVLRKDFADLATSVREAVQTTVDGVRGHLSPAKLAKRPKALKSVDRRKAGAKEAAVRKPATVRAAPPKAGPHRTSAGKKAATKRQPT
jgi:hypothetical protein